MTEEFSFRIIGAFGQAGEKWLHELPQILESVSEEWSIELLPPFQPLSYNYVVPAVKADGEPVVLKAGVPNREFSCEIDALRHFRGQGMVKLLEADHDAGLMLLERIEPGVSVQTSLDDERATSVFADVLRRMRKAIPKRHRFPGVSDWARGFQRVRDRFNGGTGPLPGPVVDRAEKVMFELIGSMTAPVVLHGDLHHWNILSAEREPWLALDPKGVIGEREYEVGAWLRNPFPQILKMPKPEKVLARRVDQLVEELGFDRGRIIGWGYCQAVLAGIWSLEEQSDEWEGFLSCADHIAALYSNG